MPNASQQDDSGSGKNPDSQSAEIPSIERLLALGYSYEEIAERCTKLRVNFDSERQPLPVYRAKPDAPPPEIVEILKKYGDGARFGDECDAALVDLIDAALLALGATYVTEIWDVAFTCRQYELEGHFFLLDSEEFMGITYHGDKETLGKVVRMMRSIWDAKNEA